MTDGDKLKAISRLKQSELAYADWHDIGRWAELCGAHFDTTILSEKACERIRTIFARFFTVDGA